MHLNREKKKDTSRMDYIPLTLAYRNDDDRAYGLAGMIFSLGNLDALDSIQEVSIDADGPMVTFTHPYYHCMSPTASARSVWEAMKRNFYLTASMVVANVMARSMVLDRANVPSTLLDDIYKEIKADGEDELSLEEDEISQLYDHILLQNRRLFGNPRLHEPLKHLSGILAIRRTMSASDIIEELQGL